MVIAAMFIGRGRPVLITAAGGWVALPEGDLDTGVFPAEVPDARIQQRVVGLVHHRALRMRSM